MLGQEGEVSTVPYQSATDWSIPITWSSISEPLFSRLDLDAILAEEESLADQDSQQNEKDPGHGIKGSGKKSKKDEIEMDKENTGIQYLDFETFMSMELRTGTIRSVEDHPNADKLYIVNIDDGTEDGRTVCAGMKPYYSPDEMTGKTIVFVANLAPR
ncbi:MAG TPA: hypothetical protein HA309_02930, partial [Candidatus Thalassarchaeaceae archaeon]|nr:hypothetical protein [Candidatus Thalassarchaeaceae archaeon]